MRHLPLLFVILFFSCSKDQQLTNDECTTKCSLSPAAGNCKAAITRYYFDQQAGKCKTFIWGGCDGVVPFDTLDECLSCGCN